MHFRVREAQEPIGQVQFLQDLHHRRVDRIPAELALKVDVGFQQHHFLWWPITDLLKQQGDTLKWCIGLDHLAKKGCFAREEAIDGCTRDRSRVGKRIHREGSQTVLANHLRCLGQEPLATLWLRIEGKDAQQFLSRREGTVERGARDTCSLGDFHKRGSDRARELLARAGENVLSKLSL